VPLLEIKIINFPAFRYLWIFRMLFDYFFLDTVERKRFYDANTNIICRVDEVWVFGPVSDGVLDEIKIAKGEGKVIRYFTIIDSKEIREIEESEVKYEEGVSKS